MAVTMITIEDGYEPKDISRQIAASVQQINNAKFIADFPFK
jgi:hypothetical protein